MGVVEDHREGCVLRVLVVPGAARSEVVGVHGDALRVRVAAPPERGRANRELVGVLARRLGVRSSAVEVVAGSTGRTKRVLIRGKAATDVEASLRRG